ncbi:hypothetical protein WDU94_008553 [Cyamophila willieti]
MVKLGSGNFSSENPPKADNFTVVNSNITQDNQSDTCCLREFSTNPFFSFVQEIFSFHFWKAKFYLLFYGEDIGPDCDPAYCPVDDISIDEQGLQEFVAALLKNSTGEDGKLDIEKLKSFVLIPVMIMILCGKVILVCYPLGMKYKGIQNEKRRKKGKRK